MRRGPLFAGLVVALLALAPPVDALAERRQVVHMAQHVALLNLAGPLLGVALPRRVLLRWVVTAAAAVLPVVVVAWHAPVLYERAVRVAAVHGVEHVLFVAAAMAFWFALTSPIRGENIVVLFAASLPVMVLGLGMTLSTTRWYAVYHEPLVRQQVAGAVMWGAGGAATVVAAVTLFYAWLSAATRSEHNRQASAPSASGNTSSAARSAHTTG
ncbi:MAG: cytochrome c oxidase assembly protein, partial [Actinobacteria bacterium]|nr:cytochrome c oxidase assembly protein [Actinomycetota bacterium]